MDKHKTILLNTESDLLNIMDIYLFFKEALGEDFESIENLLLNQEEIAFYGAEETAVIIVKENSNQYKICIESENALIEKGLCGYLTEVIEDETLYKIKEAY